MSRCRGFTLLEVLVALAIFATMAAMLLNSASESLTSAAHLEDKQMAAWIADNHMAELQLQKTPPASGRSTQEIKFADRQWRLLQDVQNTSEPSMRRVEIWVASAAQSNERDAVEDNAASHLTGFVMVNTP